MQESTPKKKRNRKPNASAKGEALIVQTRLNTLHKDKDIEKRERDAIEFVKRLRSKEKMTDREFLTEALLLMRAQWNEGYRPPALTSKTLTSEMQEALAMILDHIKMLSTLDLSGLRSQPAWNEDHFQKASSRLHESAADFLGQSKRYDEDD